MPGPDPEADVARAASGRDAVRAHLDAPGHAVENARAAVAELERGFETGALARTPTLDLMIGDLRAALAQPDGEALGGKSADAARRILAAIGRELDRV